MHKLPLGASALQGTHASGLISCLVSVRRVSTKVRTRKNQTAQGIPQQTPPALNLTQTLSRLEAELDSWRSQSLSWHQDGRNGTTLDSSVLWVSMPATILKWCEGARQDFTRGLRIHKQSCTQKGTTGGDFVGWVVQQKSSCPVVMSSDPDDSNEGNLESKSTKLAVFCG